MGSDTNSPESRRAVVDRTLQDHLLPVAFVQITLCRVQAVRPRGRVMHLPIPTHKHNLILRVIVWEKGIFLELKLPLVPSLDKFPNILLEILQHSPRRTSMLQLYTKVLRHAVFHIMESVLPSSGRVAINVRIVHIPQRGEIVRHGIVAGVGRLDEPVVRRRGFRPGVVQ